MLLLGCRLMVGQEILVLFIMVRIRAPQPNKKCPQGAFLFGVSHGLCKSVSHLHGKTLLTFCTCFGKSQISQNTSGGIPTPLCAPQPIFKYPLWAF